MFKHPPRVHFITLGDRLPQPSQIVFKIDPSTGIRMILDAHRADKNGPTEIQLDMEFAQEGGEGATPYEVLLHAALVGDSTHFTRQDSVEATWRIVQPLLDSPPPVHSYAPGTWGPPEADALVAEFGGWHGPWLPDERAGVTGNPGKRRPGVACAPMRRGQAAFLPADPGHVADVLLQDRCPADRSDQRARRRPGAIQWVLNALGRPGPADPRFRPDCTGLTLVQQPQGRPIRPRQRRRRRP